MARVGPVRVREGRRRQSRRRIVAAGLCSRSRPRRCVRDGARLARRRCRRFAVLQLDAAAVGGARAGAVLARMPAQPWWSVGVRVMRPGVAVAFTGNLAGMVVIPFCLRCGTANCSSSCPTPTARRDLHPGQLRGPNRTNIDRVASAMASPPEVVVLRGDAGRHTPYPSLFTGTGATGVPMQPPEGVDGRDRLHVNTQADRRAFCTRTIRSMH